MTIPNTARKAGPLLGTGSQTAWPFTFKVFAAGDIQVTIANSSGVETLLVLGTDYSVSLNANQETSPGGTVTYPISGSALPVGSVLAIVGDLDYDQPLDIPSGGNFSPLALENQLDRSTMQIQQLREEMNRTAKLPPTSSESVEDLVDDLQRIADSADNLDTVAENITSVNVVAADLSEPVSEINTVATSIANVNTVGNNIANVNTVAGISANVTTVAGIQANVTTVAGIAADVTAVAGISGNVTTVAGISADVQTVADNVADITNFADVYLGPKTRDPTLRNDGSALQVGDLYFNTVEQALRTYGGTQWVAGTAGTMSVQNFSGNGSTTVFTLITAPASENNTQVYIGGVYQQKDQYSVSGTTLTFAAAPPSGTDNIEVVTISTLALGTTDAALVRTTPGTGGLWSTVQGFINQLVSSAGSSFVGFIQAGVSAVQRTVQDELRERVNVKQFGASSSASAAANLTAFKAAVAAVKTGGKLIVPVDSSFYSIDTSGGLSTAIEINKRMEVVFEGDVKATYGTMQANPPYIFKVTAAGVTFSGAGRIIGNGTIDDTNAGTDDTFPGLVCVNADNFTMRGVVVDTPPKVGVMLYTCKNAKILDNTFTGGPTAYSDTAHFAVRILLGEGHLISSNSFVPSANGGMFVNCIFAAGTNNSIISNNVCIRPYEKLAYVYGNKNLITGNIVKGNESTIPGRNHPGTLTSVYRVNGSHNKITNNYSDYCIAGATAMDGVSNEISGNTFYRCGQAGIAVFAGAGYTGGFSGTTVKNNICEASAMPNVGLGDGVLVSVDGAESIEIDISGNRLYGFSAIAGSAGINLTTLAPYAVRKSTVRGNITYAGKLGIYLSRVTSSSISDNYVDSTSVQGFTDTGGAFNHWCNNRGKDAQVGISGLSSSSHGSGNQYTDANLSSVATLAAGASTTVMHGGVASNARVFLQEANGPAGILTAITGMVTSVSGSNFVIATGNGGGANGTESFHYNIVQ